MPSTPGLQINAGAVEGVFHAGAGYETFDAGDDHEVIGGLHLFATFDFLREHFGFLQSLSGSRFETVAFGEYFVFDDDRRDAGAFHFGHHVLEGIGVAAGIAVHDHRLLRDRQDFVDGVQARIEADHFNIRMALGSGIGQTAFPDGVELAGDRLVAGFPFHAGGVGDDAAEAVVGFHDADEFALGEQCFELAAPVFR